MADLHGREKYAGAYPISHLSGSTLAIVLLPKKP